MNWMLYIREMGFPKIHPLRSEAITQWTQIPRKDEIVYFGRPFVVKEVIRDYDLRVITVNVEEVSPEWYQGNPPVQSAQSETL